MTWTQPGPDGNGGTIHREMAMPCPHRCGPGWKHPAAENHRVIDADLPDNRPHRVRGEVDAMEASGRNSGYGEFIDQALAQSGYTWRNGRRQS